MKLKYLGKGESDTKEGADKIVQALDNASLIIHQREDYFTIFVEVEEDQD